VHDRLRRIDQRRKIDRLSRVTLSKQQLGEQETLVGKRFPGQPLDVVSSGSRTQRAQLANRVDRITAEQSDVRRNQIGDPLVEPRAGRIGACNSFALN
jgi:hypothetical protein